jgi:Na+/H+ antiporter NhaD/arsenite permease-like protein
VSAAAAVAIFVGAYLLIATERIHRVTAALGGAWLMLAVGLTDAAGAFFSRDTGIDWNVIFLLLGMMVIVGVMRRTGVFEYLAILSTNARGKPFRIMVMLCLITAVASALLDKLVCERLGRKPVAYLIAEALASNIGGTATLIRDPPNIIIASRSGLTFSDFLLHLAPIVVRLLAVFRGSPRCCSATRTPTTRHCRAGAADGGGHP